MPTINFRRVFIIVGVISLSVSYMGIWIRMISNPVQRTGSDFIIFYSAGRIAQVYGASHVYDLSLQHDVEEQQVGFTLQPDQVLPYNHLPFLIPILQLMINTDYVTSFYRWVLLMIFIFIAGILVTGMTLKESGMQASFIQIAAIGGILFLPFFDSLLNGQDSAFLFLGTSIWIYGFFSRKHMLSGIGLSLTTVRPHISLVLALPMLLSYRKVFWGFICGAGVLIFFSIAILGVQGTEDFVDMLVLSAEGKWYGFKPYAMFNFIGLLARIFPALGTDKIRILGWIVYGISILGLMFLWAKKKNSPNALPGVTILIALFTIPHLYLHDLTLLLIPFYELGRLGKLSLATVTCMPFAVSFLLLASGLSVFLQYTIPYLIMLVLVYYLAEYKQKLDITSPRRSPSPEK